MCVSTRAELDAEEQSRFVSLVPNMVISIFFFTIFFAKNMLVQVTFALFASKQN